MQRLLRTGLLLSVTLSLLAMSGCRRRSGASTVALASDPLTCTVEADGHNLGGTLAYVGPGDTGLVVFRGRHERDIGTWNGSGLRVRRRGAGSYEAGVLSMRGGTSAPIGPAEMAMGQTEAGDPSPSTRRFAGMATARPTRSRAASARSSSGSRRRCRGRRSAAQISAANEKLTAKAHTTPMTSSIPSRRLG